MLKRGLNIIQPQDAVDVQDEASQSGIAVYLLSVPEPADRQAFFDAVRAVLPLDPPLFGSAKWDALADSLWSGIHDLNDQSVVIAWPDADLMRNASPTDYEVALEVLRDTARSLADVQLAVGRPKNVYAYVVSSAIASV